MNVLLAIGLTLTTPAATEVEMQPATEVQELMADLERLLKEWHNATPRPPEPGELLPDFGERIRIEAEARILIGRLGNMGQDARPAVPLLCRIVREHGFPFMGERMAGAAVEALAQIGDPEALTDLAQAARTGSPELREKALQAIGQISTLRYYLVRYEFYLRIAAFALIAYAVAALGKSTVQRRGPATAA